MTKTLTKLETKNTPKLRFPVFTGEWTGQKFEDLVKINQGLQIPISERLTSQVAGSYFYITNEFLKSNSDKKYFVANPPNSVICDESDVLMTRTGNTGKVVTDVSGAFHNNFFRIKYNKDLLNKNFLVEFLRLPTTQNLILRMAGTSTIPDLNHSDFYRIEIIKPKIEEQQKIADFLGSVDAWLDNLRQQKTALETYKRGMMQKLFTQQVRFKGENGKDFPAWQQKKLGSVFLGINGIGIPKADVAVDGKYECVLYGELYTKYREVITDVVSRTNSVEGLPSLEGDLLIPTSTTTSAIDLANVTAINKAGVKLAGGICVLRAKLPVNANFYAYYLSHHKRTELAKYGQGVTIYHIYYSQFKKMEIDLPDVKEQEKIADFLTSIDQAITVKAEEIAKVEQWKKGLMQKMFV